MDHDLLKNKVILFNPRSANSKYRIPNSILQIGASIHGKYEYVFVDGNMEKDPWSVIANYLETGDFKYFGTTAVSYTHLDVYKRQRVDRSLPRAAARRARARHPAVTHVGVEVDVVLGHVASSSAPLCIVARSFPGSRVSQ